MLKHRIRIVVACFMFLAVTSSVALTQTQPKITTPKEQWGNNIGDDYFLANYKQLVGYWQKLDRESDRMKLEEIGKTAEGRTMYMAIITSPENHRNLARYKDISRRLSHVESLTDEEARRLASEGKTVVWIDGGLHATEVLGAQQLMETVFQMVSRTDTETMRFLNDVIILAVCVNPDGMDLVSDWYMREPDPLKRSTGNIPRLYQKYVGHDNNRDFYMSAQPESEAINRILYREWFPQIVYNHHQTGPAGTVMFAPPFRDPFNYNYDPLLVMELDQVGSAMHARFAAEGKPGVTMRSGANYSTWWNGGLRTTPYFHNQIGLLTETIGNPTPVDIPFIPSRHLPKADYSFPIAPQKWHFRQSIEYSITANRAVLDIASRNRDTLLYNIYRMGKNSIERGGRDTWTMTPRRVAAIEAKIAAERPQGGGGQRGGGSVVQMKYWDELHTPPLRDPRGYIIPSDQGDFLTAIKFLNTLIKTGVTVHQARAQFTAAGKPYPAGSYVVKAAQPFRPHVLDMFEPQDHPDDFAFPGGPPKPPYDSAGWTLAMQMGVKFDRILDAFDGPLEKVPDVIRPPTGRITQLPNATGYLLSHEINDSFVAINRLLGSSEDVYWLKQPMTANGKTYPAGTVYVPAKPSTLAKLQRLATDVGLSFDAIAVKPSGEAMMLRPLRIGLWDRYGGSMPSGWTRYILEKFEFPFTVVYPRTLDEGNLSSKFDVLIFVDGGIPETDGGGGGFGGMPAAESIPPQFRDWLGNVTVSKTVPQLKKFLEDGGTVLAIGGSTSMGFHSDLPIADHLVERRPDGTERGLNQQQFYVPGSVLQARVDKSNPLAFGLSDRVDMFFDNSPVFRLKPDAEMKGVKPVAWFDSKSPLRSGWAWGQSYLEGGVAVIDATVGKGKLFLFGPEISFRSQPHGTFKFLFNGIYAGRTEPVNFQ